MKRTVAALLTSGLLLGSTLAQAESCYRDLLGATGADFAAVGDFDPAALEARTAPSGRPVPRALRD